MSGSHGCGTWKKSQTSKGYIKRTTTDTGKWYTQTSTRTEPGKRRATTKTWGGALQLGKNVYISGGPWFEYMGTGSGTGDDSFKVHGMNMSQTKTWFSEKGVPYNKIWWQGSDDLGIKVPGGSLWDMGWPWSKKIGYPTTWEVHYWIWSEDDPTKKKVTYTEFQNWITYIDIHGQLSTDELKIFMSASMNEYVAMQGGNSALRRGIDYSGRTDLVGMLADIGAFYSQRGWSLTIAEKQIIQEQWGLLWTMILDDDNVFNKIWFISHGYI